jgi:hypothetical protein
MTILYVKPLAIDRSVSEKRTLRLHLPAAALSGAAGSGKNRAGRELHAIGDTRRGVGLVLKSRERGEEKAGSDQFATHGGVGA